MYNENVLLCHYVPWPSKIVFHYSIGISRFNLCLNLMNLGSSVLLYLQSWGPLCHPSFPQVQMYSPGFLEHQLLFSDLGVVKLAIQTGHLSASGRMQPPMFSFPMSPWFFWLSILQFISLVTSLPFQREEWWESEGQTSSNMSSCCFWVVLMKMRTA